MGFDSFKFADVILPPIHVHHFAVRLQAGSGPWTGWGGVDPYILFCDQYELPSSPVPAEFPDLPLLLTVICLHSLQNVQENHSSFLHFFQMMSPEHLTCGWLLHLLLVFLKPCGAPAGPARPLNGSDCTARGPAAYLLVFTGQWSPQAFPKQYPLFRPPAQWSKLMGKSHCCEVITGNPSADGEHRPFFFLQLC